MKSSVGMLLVCASLLFTVKVCATTLPDACGADAVKFHVNTQKNQSQPAGPNADEAQIIFVETIESDTGSFCIGCDVTTRFGVDGAWVGANKGDSYFVYNVPAGEHHLCVNWQSRFHTLNKNVDVASLNAETGKTYYFEARVAIESRDVGQKLPMEINRLYLKQLNEDEGKYQVKISALSTAKRK